jgi:hypothetical protein
VTYRQVGKPKKISRQDAEKTQRLREGRILVICDLLLVWICGVLLEAKETSQFFGLSLSTLATLRLGVRFFRLFGVVA